VLVGLRAVPHVRKPHTTRLSCMRSSVKSSGLPVAAGALCGLAAGAASLALVTRSRPRSLAGKAVLITGGSRGLGLELARQLGRQGSKLILVARHEDELEKVATELTRAGVSVHTIAADIADPETGPRLRTKALEAFGRIDILINVAGVILVGPIDSLEIPDFEQAMNVMYWGMVRTTLAFLPDLLEIGDADIVNITSIGGKIAVPHLLPYSAAKFAATGFSEGLNAELRGRGVHVLTVAPGLMRTGSFLQAEFTGAVDAEYRWFALSAALPGISINVKQAAGQIIRSLKRRDRELVITKVAQTAARVKGTFPAMTQAVLEKVNDLLLPRPNTAKQHRTGKELDNAQPVLFHKATTLGRAAAATHNE
jgi:short-subunit dehydrogenase